MSASRIDKVTQESAELTQQVRNLNEPLRIEYYRRWDLLRAGITQLQLAQARINLAKHRQSQNEKARTRVIQWGSVVLVALVIIRWLNDSDISQSTSDIVLIVIAYLSYFYLSTVREKDVLKLEDLVAEKNRLEFTVESAGVNSVYLAELYRYWDKQGEGENSPPSDKQKADNYDIYNRMQRRILQRITNSS